MEYEQSGPIYCSEQIKIPPELPEIMKQFTKAAIRTQPADLLSWSAAYFQALNDGVEPPVKDRLELELPPNKGGMSKGLLKILHRQIGAEMDLTYATLSSKWVKLGMTRNILEEICALGGFDLEGECQGEELCWPKVLVLSCSVLNPNLTDTMMTLCEVLTSDPEGGAARIRYELFSSLFEFLCQKDGRVSNEEVKSVFSYLADIAAKQDDMVGPADFQHKDCPVLRLLV